MLLILVFFLGSTLAAEVAPPPSASAEVQAEQATPAPQREPGPYDPVLYRCHDLGFLLQTRKNHSMTARAREGEWTTTCENEVMSLDCGRGNIITIIDVEYGRFDTVTCHSYPLFFMKCESNDAYSKVHQRCDNKQRCTVSATADEFGDPCPGIVKYLRVKHRCEPVKPEDLKSKTVCEHEEASISCPEGTTLMIADAFYGRMDRTTCPSDRILTTDCKAENSLDIVSSRCDHKQTCNLTSANSQFEDPCIGTFKYLQLDYQCVTDDLQQATACEGGELVLECRNTSFINVVRAEYGRGHPFTCNPTSRKVDPAGCSSPNELAIVFGKCQGRQTCTIPATSAVFGEPCTGKPKYLEVDFFCLQRYVASDSGGPPQISSIGRDRLTFFSSKLNETTSLGYVAQLKGADEDQWFTVMDTDEEPFDFSKPHTVGGLLPDHQYDSRIIKKRGVTSACIPFTRVRARKP